MKKLITLILAAAMLLALAACAKAPEDDESEGAEQGEGVEVSLDISIGEDENDRNVIEHHKIETSAEAKDEEPEGEHYVICTDEYGYVPFIFYDNNTDRYAGFDLDLLDAIAEEQGFTYELVYEQFDDCFDMLRDGDADGMIAGVKYNEERNGEFLLSDAYFTDGVTLACRTDNTDIYSLEDLQQKVIGCVEDTYAEYCATQYDTVYGYAFEWYEDSRSMYKALEDGEIAACIDDYSTISWMLSEESYDIELRGELIDPYDYVFVAAQGASELCDAFNAGLASLEDSGELDALLADYGLS